MAERSATSIKKRLMKFNMLLSTIALLLACTGYCTFDLVTFRHNMVRNMITQAQIVGLNSTAAIATKDQDVATKILSSLSVRPAFMSAGLYTADGHLFAVWQQPTATDSSYMLQATIPLYKQSVHHFDFNSLQLIEPIYENGRHIGMVYLQSNLHDLKLRLKRYMGITVIVFILSSLIIIPVSRELGVHILKPVLDLVKTAETIAEKKDYSVRASGVSNDEIGLLVQAFNQMLDEIEKRRIALQSSHDNLEHRVSERTSQLQDANKAEIRLNKFLDSIIENIPNMVFVKRATDLRFVRFNKVGEQLLGYERSTLIGKNDYDFFPKNEADFFTAKDRQVLANRELVDIAEEPIQTKDKGTRFLHTKKIPLFDERGNPEYLLGISEDITERKEAEQAIHALNMELAHKASQLEASNKELESFSYSVSHDLRAPLRAIDGFSLALLEDCGDVIDANGHSHLKRIRVASQQMAQLIDDMLNLSRITRGSLSFHEADLSSLSSTIMTNLQKEEPQRHVEIDIAPDVKVQGDSHLLKIALENLLTNAWKFTAKTKDPRITFFTTTDSEGVKTYCVRDNGAGFDMKYVDKLFRPFQRLHSNDDFHGTGIGLATVQRIISRHGGRVWAEGQVNHGASFYFTLG